MRDKPHLSDDTILTRLHQDYEIAVAQVEFLPLGADYNSAVYRVQDRKSYPYFLKLRKDNFEETSLLVPYYLNEQGISQVIPPVKTKDGRLYTRLESYSCILYPYISGEDGFERQLSEKQWIEFGAARRKIHDLLLPPDLSGRIAIETFSPYWQERVKSFQEQVERTVFTDPISAQMAEIMKAQRDEIRLAVERAGQLASTLHSQSLPRVLCHSDIHASNLLLGEDGGLYIIDWDNPVLAPKERDLMFIGGGIGEIWNSTREEALFYQGYGPTNIHLEALTYYRYERIIQDIAAYCEEVLVTNGGSADREQGLRYFTSQFSPGSVLEIACQTDQKLVD